ncbi:UNVERIFIED_CONTAM: hypothetical protein Slati_3414200 [Sesamum latifolium]|uniref:Uncharacterized protein n=1 Tax=Sesamum latifolium TaxID=2727402 RepID=A0AAW2UGC9_9LAMI
MPALYLRAYSWVSALISGLISSQGFPGCLLFISGLILGCLLFISGLYLRGALLVARLRNLAGRIVSCPPEAGLRCLRGGGLRCLHGKELTSSPQKDLGACLKEGLCDCVEDRAFYDKVPA